jgi:hypothetical protein
VREVARTVFWHSTCLAKSVPYSDRAFRALVRDRPDVLVALLDAVVRPRLALTGVVTPEDVDDTHLDLPATLDADSVARCGDTVLHTEFQGYRDRTFDDRVFRYHLLLTLRYPAFRVETIALWIKRPSEVQRRGLITRHNVTLNVHVVVLPEIPALELLADPRTACFAPCASASDLSDEELCMRVATILRERGTGRQFHMAVVAAATCKRYHQMIKAMEAAKIEPVVIEDLVEIGRDMGFDEGVTQGVEAARGMLLETLSARGLVASAAQLERIAEERSLDRIRQWHRAALTAESADDALGE